MMEEFDYFNKWEIFEKNGSIVYQFEESNMVEV